MGITKVMVAETYRDRSDPLCCGIYDSSCHGCPFVPTRHIALHSVLELLSIVIPIPAPRFNSTILSFVVSAGQNYALCLFLCENTTHC
jgi:hypothetical protein